MLELGLKDADVLEDGLTEALGDWEALLLELGLTLAEIDEDGLTLAEGDCEGLDELEGLVEG